MPNEKEKKGKQAFKNGDGMKPRQPEFENKIFSGDEGNYNGWRVLVSPDFENEKGSGFVEIHIFYKDGKVDGDPAILYPDGLEETWENGKFVKVAQLPYKQRYA
jgi:antitoxin component YwqK of YwqJK toxin-antitoxin module